MKKVVMIVTNRYDPDVRVHKEAKYLIESGYEVEILCWDRENDYTDREVEVMDGVKIKRFFPYAKYGTGYKQIVAYYRFLQEVKKYLNNITYDYLHCHDLDGVIVGSLSNRKKKKLIFDMHEFYEVLGSNQKIRYIIRGIVSYFQSMSDHIIYVNEEQIKVAKDKNKSKAIYIPNYPDDETFKDVQKYPSDKLRIAYIGAVRQYSQLKNLMDACKDMDTVEVLIHGMGVAHNSLQNIKFEYSNVEVTGTFSINQVGELYKNADVLYVVYPMDNLQNKLSYPVKFFEGILTKTPIIGSKNSQIESFMKKYDIGFGVDGDSVESIRECIEMILGNKEILDKKVENLTKIQLDFTWKEVVMLLDKIYCD